MNQNASFAYPHTAATIINATIYSSQRTGFFFFSRISAANVFQCSE